MNHLMILSTLLVSPMNLGGGFIFFNFHPYLGKWSNLTNIFQMGWNHQLGIQNMKTNPIDDNSATPQKRRKIKLYTRIQHDTLPPHGSLKPRWGLGFFKMPWGVVARRWSLRPSLRLGNADTESGRLWIPASELSLDANQCLEVERIR